MTEAVPGRPVYLDYQATTPVDPRVLEALLPWLQNGFGNPHSTGHDFGRAAAVAVETAREQVAAVIGAEPREIIFTSGATEANNLAIKGAARYARRYGGESRRRIVTLATEHKCVLEAVRDLAEEGFEPVVVPVSPDGLFDAALLARAVTPETLLLSAMAANNEIGVLQDIAAAADIAHAAGALFHSDAAQAFGKIPLDAKAQGFDLLSISGHKIYAPKGIGALYVRRRPRARLLPLFSGGGQERGLRSGTLSPALCVALGRAAEICAGEMAVEEIRLRGLAGLFLEGLQDLPGVMVNGHRERRLAGNLNLSVAGVTATELLAALPDLALATGSACSSAEIEPSYVLAALGLGREAAATGIRIGFGRFTTEPEIRFAALEIGKAVGALRRHAAQ